jgi:Domain of unknown function (DUF4234)
MAYGDSFQLQGSSESFKVRGPVWVGVCSILTLWIYAIYWTYVTAKHLSDYGRARGYDLGQSPGMTLLAVAVGWIIIVPPLVAYWRLTKRVQQAQRIAGRSEVLNGWIALVLFLVLSPVYLAYVQSELNKVWQAEGGPVPTPTGELPPRTETTPERPAPDTTTAPPPPSGPERPPGA